VKDDFSYTPAAASSSQIAAAAAVPTKQTAGDVSKSLEAIDEVSTALHGTGTFC
jgi:hypothetical protein